MAIFYFEGYFIVSPLSSDVVFFYDHFVPSTTDTMDQYYQPFMIHTRRDYDFLEERQLVLRTTGKALEQSS